MARYDVPDIDEGLHHTIDEWEEPDRELLLNILSPLVFGNIGSSTESSSLKRGGGVRRSETQDE